MLDFNQLKAVPEDKKERLINLLIMLYKENEFGFLGFGSVFDNYWAIRTKNFDKRRDDEAKLRGEKIVKNKKDEDIKDKSVEQTGCYIYATNKKTNKEFVVNTYEFIFNLPISLLDDKVEQEKKEIYAPIIENINSLLANV